MMDQNDVVVGITNILLRYGYSYKEKVINGFDGRHVWVTPENSCYDIKVEPTETVCVWHFEHGREHADRMRYEALLDWLPGALEDELIVDNATKEKQGLRRMRRGYV